MKLYCGDISHGLSNTSHNYEYDLNDKIYVLIENEDG